MSEADENIWLLSNFHPDPTTINNVKLLVLPWAVKYLGELEWLHSLRPEAVGVDEINQLRRGIETCHTRLQAA